MSTAENSRESGSRSDQSGPIEWTDVAERLTDGGWFWLSTVRPSGEPHCVPLFAAWADPLFYIASNPGARKTRNLLSNAACVVTKDLGELHLSVQGTARQVLDTPGLERASRAFREVYDWPTRASGKRLDADYGAPTSGGPPYDVFAVAPDNAFVFPAGNDRTPTRISF